MEIVHPDAAGSPSDKVEYVSHLHIASVKTLAGAASRRYVGVGQAAWGGNNGGMSHIKIHLRNTFLAGIFAAIPLAVTAFVVWYVETATRRLFHVPIPFVGVLLALGGIYALGLAVTSLIGQFLLRFIDRVLLRVPVLKELYQAWKHVSLTPGGRGGIFSRVVLIPVENGQMRQLGFSSGQGLMDDPTMTCVFVPAAPNPTNGRIYFAKLADCRFLDISVEEAFKVILSGGNYIPPAVGLATQRGGDQAQD
jgi:uncharacterized membrane protein